MRSGLASGWLPLLVIVAFAACAFRDSRPSHPVVIPREPEREPEPAYVVPTGAELVGRVDTTFGGAGAVLLEKAPGEQRLSAITQLSDGSFVGVGYAPYGDSYDICAARVMNAGTLDESFGDKGFARVGERRGFGQAVASDAQGRILVAGYVSAKQGNDALIARLDARGRLDPSFGTNGIVVHDAGNNDQPHALFVRADGRILVVGYLSSSQNAVMRLLPNGGLDPEFGTNGVAAYGDKETGYATRAVLAPDGAVIAGGYVAREKRGFVARIDANGRPDARFGNRGIAFVDEPAMSSAWAVGVDSKGRVLLGGSTSSGAAIVRFEPDGRPDPTFGDHGVAWSDRAGDEQFYAFAFDSAENVIGVGFRDIADAAAALVVRFRSNGSIDTKFGNAGRIVHKLDGGTFLFAATWDKSGGIVGAGDLWKGDRSRALIMRFR